MHKGARSLSNDHQPNTNCTAHCRLPACGFSLSEPVDPSPQSLNLPPHRRGKVTLLPDENHASKRCVRFFFGFFVVRSGNEFFYVRKNKSSLYIKYIFRPLVPWKFDSFGPDFISHWIKNEFIHKSLRSKVCFTYILD